jgi:hypothetical protein
MARAYFDHLVLNSTGDIQRRVLVYLYEIDGVTPLAQTLYTADTGGTVLANPLVSDDQGHVEAYADEPQRLVVKTGAISRVGELRPHPNPGATSQPRAQVRFAGNQNLSDNTQTVIDFFNVVYDTDSAFSISQVKRLTAPEDGLYDVKACVLLSGPSAGFFLVEILLTNGSGTRQKVAFNSALGNSSTLIGVNVSKDVEMAAADYVEVGVTIIGAGMVTSLDGTTYPLAAPTFSLHWVAPLSS